MKTAARVTFLGACMLWAAWCPAGEGLSLESLKAAPADIVPAVGHSAAGLRLDRQWEGAVCRATLTNGGAEAVRVREVVLARAAHDYPPETAYYGEGFTMLSQTGGTLGQPVDIGGLTDRGHYRIPQPENALTAYGMFTLSPEGGPAVAMGFTSCRRFVGKFHLRADSVEAVLDLENLELAPGESWALEELWFGAGPDREALLAELGDLLGANHPPLCQAPVPAGWCSWYCFGPTVTARQVGRNLDFIAGTLPALRYVQIDDGYQAAMGDWLDTGKAFGGGIREVLGQIREKGLEPAIWVAPFIAEEKSRVFQEHPDWFIMDGEGKPLRSDLVTFGGWRNGPWYAVDGTHPEAQKHLETVFRTMREEWGCTYFKLDANFWGAMHGGRFHDPKATRVEAYRRGMEAVLRGAGDGFVLGCNHPLWPSLGVVHGARVSNDVGRSWESFTGIAREVFHRNWQNGRLWWNDPDCVLLYGSRKMTDGEFLFHATAVYASGGMTLSGDDLPRLTPERLEMLRKLLPPTGVAARFDDDSFRVGRVALGDKTMICVFNWGDAPQSATVGLAQKTRVKDYWTGEDLGEREGALELKDMPGRSGRLLECVP
ncbi:MAG: alpha-galactosidase [Candidatus Hydrogenedentes bacterium]|nr:alpha-galactosidase [Candidatus Hydrogenedentota bacterium]